MTAKIKVIGVGGGGSNAVHNMVTAELRGVEFICANTDVQALLQASEVVRRIQIGEKLTKGLGAGANPQIGRDAAQESLAAIKEAVSDADMLFVTAGMGGGTGTGAAPVVAQAARELGILTVGVVTRPFSFESGRPKVAEQGIVELRQHVDSLIVIPNDRLLSIAPKNARFIDMFKRVDDVLHAAVRGIADLITTPGYMNLDFADVRTAMAESGYAMMGAGRATGEGRAVEAARMAIASPLLEGVSIAGARAVLINVTATQDIGMDEYSEAMYLIQEAALGESGESHVFAGMAFDDDAGDEVRITVIATGIDNGADQGKTAQTSAGGPVVTTFPGGRGRGGFAQPDPAPPVGSAAQTDTGIRRHYPITQGGDGWSDIPPYIRKGTSRLLGAEHKPGGEDFIFGNEDSEELDLPTFLRRQAN